MALSCRLAVMATRGDKVATWHRRKQLLLSGTDREMCEDILQSVGGI